MPQGLLILSVVGVIAIVVLVWFLTRKLGEDKIEELLKKRRSGAKVSIKAEYVESRSRALVAMTLTDKTLFYENVDLEARLDLDRLEEVEYDDELFTGQSVHGKVLRLRSHGQTFEFVLEPAHAKLLEDHLPPHRMDEPGDVHAV